MVTVDDEDYDLSYAELNLEGGVDGDYTPFGDIDDLDDVWHTDIRMALYPNPFKAAYLVGDVNATSNVYGIVTDITVSGLFDNVTDVTIFNQDGEEATYDVNDGDVITYGSEAVDAPNVELGSYVEVKIDADGAIDSLVKVIYADDVSDDTVCNVSNSKVKIDGTWYKITDDTLIFETTTIDGVALYRQPGL